MALPRALQVIAKIKGSAEAASTPTAHAAMSVGNHVESVTYDAITGTIEARLIVNRR